MSTLGLACIRVSCEFFSILFTIKRLSDYLSGYTGSFAKRCSRDPPPPYASEDNILSLLAYRVEWTNVIKDYALDVSCSSF